MPHGKICYLEIPAKTAEASADFYSNIFGWKVRKRGDGALAFDDSGCVSGTWVKESDRTPDERTRTYIMVDSIADTLKRIQTAGGRVLTPRTDIGPGMGAFAALKRSSGGMEALLKLGLASQGRVPPSKGYVWRNLSLDVGHVLTYFVAHEAHHRGQIVMVARQGGQRLPRPATDGLWQWKMDL